MNKILLYSLIILPMLVNTSFTLAAEVEFYDGSFTEAKAKATREGKLLMIDFMADWCAPCKAMEQFTFPNENVASYLKANYIAFRANIDHFEGYELKQNFGVKVLPTILILNTTGATVGKFEESMTPNRMIEVLKSFNIPANRNGANAAPPVPSPAMVKSPSAVKEAPVKPVVTAPAAPKTAKTVPPAAKTTPPPYRDGLNFKLTEDNQTGFSVQTGTFGKYDNAMNEIKRLQQLLGEQTVYMHIGTLNGATAYRVMVGACADRNAATILQAKLRNKGVACFIQDLAKLTKV